MSKLQYSNIEPKALIDALNSTAQKRESVEVIKDYRKIMDTVRNNKVMKRQRENYRKDFEYAEGIAFEDVCDTVVGLMEEIIVETPQNHVNSGFLKGKREMIKILFICHGRIFSELS